jgi:hypothetical protein
LHLNISGKGNVAELNKKKLTVRKEETPITLKLEESLKDPTQEVTKEKLINYNNKEPYQKEVNKTKTKSSYEKWEVFLWITD